MRVFSCSGLTVPDIKACLDASTAWSHLHRSSGPVVVAYACCDSFCSVSVQPCEATTASSFRDDFAGSTPARTAASPADSARCAWRRQRHTDRFVAAQVSSSLARGRQPAERRGSTQDRGRRQGCTGHERGRAAGQRDNPAGGQAWTAADEWSGLDTGAPS